MWEWTETTNVLDWSGPSYVTSAVLRGAMFNSDNPSGLESWYRHSDGPFKMSDGIGFRVASVPEPTSLSFLTLSILAFLLKRKK